MSPSGVALDPLVPLVLRGALGLLFAAAAAHKLRDPTGFRATLADYRLLPGATLGLASGALIAFEAGLAAALWVPATAPGASLAAAGLLVVYTGAIGANLARGRRHVACGCLGPAAEQPLHAGLLARNGVLAAAALASTLPVSGRALGGTDAFTGVAAVATLALLYLAVDGLLAAGRLATVRGAS